MSWFDQSPACIALNGAISQNRCGVGPPLESVGLKIYSSQVIASWYCWFCISEEATNIGTW